MKIFLSIFVIAILVSLSACKQSSGDKDKNQEEQSAQVYTCSMHPEVQSDKPGDCPKCGMELVISEEHVHPDSSSNVDDEIN